MTKPSHKLTERNALVALIPDDEILNIDVNCPHCGWRAILHCARTKDNQVAVVGEGICGHAREWLVTAGGNIRLTSNSPKIADTLASTLYHPWTKIDPPEERPRAGRSLCDLNPFLCSSKKIDIFRKVLARENTHAVS